MAHQDNPEFFKGRGAQVNTDNKFLKRKYVIDHIEGLDEPLLENSATQLFEKLQIKSRIGLVLYAIKHKLIDL